MSDIKVDHHVVAESEEAIESRKQAAAELRKARKALRDPRSRLLSDSTDEVPKGILKNARIPKKRSASECVDDLSRIIAGLCMNEMPGDAIYCPLHQSYFDEQDEAKADDEDASDADEDDGDDEEDDGDEDDHHRASLPDRSKQGGDTETITSEIERKPKIKGNITGLSVDNQQKKPVRKCDCYLKFSDRHESNNSSVEKPKKSVRFDEKVYETVFFAARLYDRRSFVKYHSSTRHHPPMNNKQSNKSKKNRSGSISSDHGDDDKHVCRQTKSQRAKQSKKDKKKRRLSKREESNSDDQGYCSSIHSFSD